MDVNTPRFAEDQERFEEVADLAERQDGPQPEIGSARMMLCLYGDNGLPPEDEFAMLAAMEDYVGRGLRRVDINTAYWQDVVLYLPRDEDAAG